MSIPSVSTIPWQFWFKGFYCVVRIFASHIFACSIAHLFRARLAMPQCDWTQWKQSKAQIDSLKDESVIADNKVQFLEFQVDVLKDEVVMLEKAGHLLALNHELQVDSLKDELVIAEMRKPNSSVSCVAQAVNTLITESGLLCLNDI